MKKQSDNSSPIHSSKIGFVDLGVMGSRMARRLLEAGFEVVVYNRSQEAEAYGLLSILLNERLSRLFACKEETT